jgi:hypothetical protein
LSFHLFVCLLVGWWVCLFSYLFVYLSIAKLKNIQQFVKLIAVGHD